MRKALILSFLAAMMLATSCKKEPIEPPPPPDPCENITCFNGGVCINGACDCPPQYTGPACSQEVHPIKMKVGTIKLTDFPPTAAGGAGWDTFDGADVYITIHKAGVLIFETGYFENLTGAQNFTANFEFSDPTATHQMSVYDYDFGITTDDYIGGISFTPYQSGAGFPTSYTLDCTGCVVEFQLLNIAYFH